MYEHLKVSRYKNIEEVVMKDLGKINVICGKNNSGKTSVLEGIKESKHRVEGITLTQDHVRKAIDFAHQTQNWHYARNTEFYAALPSVIGQALGKQTIWFEDELAHFQQYLSAFKNLSVLKTIEIINSEQIFTSLFKGASQFVLIPTKRSLGYQENLRENSNVEENGAGIINSLFKFKNQESDQPESIFFQELNSLFSEISDGFFFDVTLKNGNVLNLVFSKTKSKWVSANTCGLGLQDLLTILYWCLRNEFQIALIEEPETHIHPEMQRRLINTISKFPSKQIFLTTHSNVFLGNLFADKVFHTKFQGKVGMSDSTSTAIILNDLGYSVSENLLSDLVVLVEGPGDIHVLEELLNKIDQLKNHAIKFWPLGGDIMDQVDLSVICQSFNVVALIDNDPGSEKVRKDFISGAGKLGIEVCRLERYSIENYFSLRALRKVFPKIIPENMTQILPEIKLEEQINFNVKKNNRKIAREMDISEIDGTDLAGFIELVINKLNSNSGIRKLKQA